ncbi:MAG: putative transporter [Alphaproteobacteria bacterium]|nr:putative transporter [Alphaproteobacteria bacterium]MBO4643898.1 putative transporter [Alphaproteobacteria bacterium]
MSLTVITILCISITSVIGIFIGSLKFKGIGIGVGGVLFAGLLAGYLLERFAVVLNPEVLTFLKEFGLILFIYSMGLTVGPNIFASLRKNGLTLNLIALAVTTLGTVIAVLIFKFGNFSLPELIGLYSGAVTSTPALGSGQQILAELGEKADIIEKSGFTYAIAYPFTIISGIFVFAMLKAVFHVKVTDEVAAYETQKVDNDPHMQGFNVLVNNPSFDGLEIGDFLKMMHYTMTISRMKRDNEYIIPHEHIKLQMGDILLIFGPRKIFQEISFLFRLAPEQDLMEESAKQIQSQTLLLTNYRRVGKPLKKILGDTRHHWVISRVIRNGISLSPTPELKLAYADEVVVVGKKEETKPLIRYLGNDQETANDTRFIPFFLGMTLGILVGLIPFHIPGVEIPLKLGTSGGPLIVAMLLAYRGSWGRIVFYTPPHVLKAFKFLGILLFLAVVGIASGPGFIKLISRTEGLYFVGLGILITAVPLLTVGVFMRLVKKMNYLTLCGALSGCITCLPTMTFVSNMSNSDAPAIGYATVYPLTIALRVISAQVLALMLF